ncbi:MAG: hypothetical protein ACXWDL_09260, partial [Nocardioides sp.]
LAVVTCVVALMTSCSGDDPDVTPPEASSQAGPSLEEGAEPSEAAQETVSEPPVVELPTPLKLRDVDGRTIAAKPFADFAVAAADGVWVTGVSPGAVRYDDTSGRITARTGLDGGVEQALEHSAGSVWIPTTAPELLRVDADTGQVMTRTPLPVNPVPEGVVGAVGATAYVLADEVEPTIFVVERGRVTDRIPAPDFAVAVRAGYGALWVPTATSTVERYDLETGDWTSIPTGPGPRFLDVGFGAVWVMDQGDGSVTRIDARTLEPKVLSGSQNLIGGGDLTTGGGGVWLRTDDSVLRIDPRSHEVTHLLELPPGSGSVAATPRALWITNHDHLAVHVVPLPLPS